MSQVLVDPRCLSKLITYLLSEQHWLVSTGLEGIQGGRYSKKRKNFQKTVTVGFSANKLPARSPGPDSASSQGYQSYISKPPSRKFSAFAPFQKPHCRWN